jgi:ribosomal protein L40E
MLCAKCNKDNPADASFCEECGAQLELICPACKASVSPGARFCKKCGTALADTRPDSHPPIFPRGHRQPGDLKITGCRRFMAAWSTLIANSLTRRSRVDVRSNSDYG